MPDCIPWCVEQRGQRHQRSATLTIIDLRPWLTSAALRRPANATGRDVHGHFDGIITNRFWILGWQHYQHNRHRSGPLVHDRWHEHGQLDGLRPQGSSNQTRTAYIVASIRLWLTSAPARRQVWRRSWCILRTILQALSQSILDFGTFHDQHDRTSVDYTYTRRNQHGESNNLRSSGSSAPTSRAISLLPHRTPRRRNSISSARRTTRRHQRQHYCVGLPVTPAASMV